MNERHKTERERYCVECRSLKREREREMYIFSCSLEKKIASFLCGSVCSKDEDKVTSGEFEKRKEKQKVNRERDFYHNECFTCFVILLQYSR